MLTKVSELRFAVAKHSTRWLGVHKRLSKQLHWTAAQCGYSSTSLARRKEVSRSTLYSTRANKTVDGGGMSRMKVSRDSAE